MQVSSILVVVISLLAHKNTSEVHHQRVRIPRPAPTRAEVEVALHQTVLQNDNLSVGLDSPESPSSSVLPFSYQDFEEYTGVTAEGLSQDHARGRLCSIDNKSWTNIL